MTQKTEAEYLADTIRIYDEWAKAFSENITQTDDYLPYYEQFLKVITGKRIVDLGCGSGRDVRYFREAGYESTGVDISSGLVELCQSDSIIQENVILGDITRADEIFEPASVDGVWMSASIVHMSKELGAQTIARAANVLAPHGCMFVSVKYRPIGEVQETVKESRSIPGTFKRYVYYSEAEIRNLFVENGLIIVWSELKISTNWGDNWFVVVGVKS